jgi:hypothetical protein
MAAIPRSMHIRRLAAGVAGLLWFFAPAALAFAIPYVQATVVEYYNTNLGHYFLTADPVEEQGIDNGSAGPGWVKTGYSFLAYTYPLRGNACFTGPDCGLPVARFYGTPGIGPNSHFYTANAAEAEGLEKPGSGWTFERFEFTVSVPGASGQCATGLTPVYRLYNNRWMFNDSNHRYVSSAEERSKMLSRGWLDEGIAFCSLAAKDIPVKSFEVSIDLTNKILPSSVCEDESANLGPCMAVNNLPAPTTLYPPTQPERMPGVFFDRTGMSTSFVYTESAGPAATSANDTFVEGAGPILGIHIDTSRRGRSMYSSVNPLYQFRTTVSPGAFDGRFFPWGAYESDVELALRFTLNVKVINLRSAGSAAYGHPTIEFIDQRSGRHLYFTVLTYGTVAPSDYLAPDVTTGKVIVGTTFRSDTPFGRSLGVSTLPTPTGFVSPNDWGWGGPFEFRMNRSEFQHVLDTARTIEPALSPAPADYLVDNFHFNNEVYGDGEIGVNIEFFTLDLVRR